MTNKFIKIGLISISDRASQGVYEDLGISSLKEWLNSSLISPFETEEHLIPDDLATIQSTLIDLCDKSNCGLVLTTGGTGPSQRDITPEATLSIADKELPGFGEQMRQISLNFVPTAILSRQVAVIRKKKKIEKEEAKKEPAPKPKSILKLGDRVRMIDGIAIGTIDKIEKKKDFVNYGTFTTNVSLTELEKV